MPGADGRVGVDLAARRGVLMTAVVTEVTWDELHAEYLKEIAAKVAAEAMNSDLMTRLGVQLTLARTDRSGRRPCRIAG